MEPRQFIAKKLPEQITMSGCLTGRPLSLRFVPVEMIAIIFFLIFVSFIHHFGKYTPCLSSASLAAECDVAFKQQQ